MGVERAKLLLAKAKTIETEIELSSDILYSQGVYKNHYSLRELEEDMETANRLGIIE